MKRTSEDTDIVVMRAMALIAFLVLMFMFIFIFITTAHAGPMPAHVQYVINHWLQTDHLGNVIGYDMKIYAKATTEFGEFSIPCGYDAGHWGLDNNRRRVWIADPNAAMAECEELRKKWDNEKLLKFTMGDKYVPTLQDANQVAEEWINK